MFLFLVIAGQIILVALVVTMFFRKKPKTEYTFIFTTEEGQVGTFTVRNEYMFHWCKQEENSAALIYILSAPDINWSFVPEGLDREEIDHLRGSLLFHENQFSKPNGYTEYGVINASKMFY